MRAVKLQTPVWSRHQPADWSPRRAPLCDPPARPSVSRPRDTGKTIKSTVADLKSEVCTAGALEHERPSGLKTGVSEPGGPGPEGPWGDQGPLMSLTCGPSHCLDALARSQERKLLREQCRAHQAGPQPASCSNTAFAPSLLLLKTDVREPKRKTYKLAPASGWSWHRAVTHSVALVHPGGRDKGVLTPLLPLSLSPHSSWHWLGCLALQQDTVFHWPLGGVQVSAHLGRRFCTCEWL